MVATRLANRLAEDGSQLLGRRPVGGLEVNLVVFAVRLNAFGFDRRLDHLGEHPLWLQDHRCDQPRAEFRH